MLYSEDVMGLSPVILLIGDHQTIRIYDKDKNASGLNEFPQGLRDFQL